MSEMVERVAKAMFDCQDPPMTWQSMAENYRDQKRKEARAAIEAMRVPSPDTEGLRMWNHMLDEALK